MAKKVLILVLSSDFIPYSAMIETSRRTWDSVEVNGCETIFYCSIKDNPNFRQSEKVMYWDVDNTLFSMGWKNLAMFEWALKNKEFDYVARLNASCYCDKKNLMEYVETLPYENVFAGAEAQSVHGFFYLWGGAQYIISRDVLQKIVDNKREWQHSLMEDEAMSMLVKGLHIPYSEGYSGAIDNMGDHWRCISYGGESITFTDFADLKRLKHHFYRIKCDGKRYMETFIMDTLFKTLNQ